MNTASRASCAKLEPLAGNRKAIGQKVPALSGLDLLKMLSGREESESAC